MKRVSATDVRKNWFRLLDEVVAGEVVLVERKGRYVVLRAEDPDRVAEAATLPDYRRLLRAVRIDDADQWSWEWTGEGVEPRTRPPGDPAFNDPA